MHGLHGFNPSITTVKNGLIDFCDAAKTTACKLLESGLYVVVSNVFTIDYLIKGLMQQDPNNVKALEARAVRHIHKHGETEFCLECYLTDT